MTFEHLFHARCYVDTKRKQNRVSILKKLKLSTIWGENT